MTFHDLWKRVSELGVLPDTAIIQIPSVLNRQTKTKLTKKSPEEAAKIISSAIEEINRGSVETVDTLVLRKLKK